MSKTGFSLPEHPWLFLLVFILITLAGNVIFTILLAYPLKLPRTSPLFDFWVNVLNNTASSSFSLCLLCWGSPGGRTLTLPTLPKYALPNGSPCSDCFCWAFPAG